MLGTFPRSEWNTLDEKIGMLPLFPTPSSHVNTTTMMGGWVFSIPQASPHKDLAWKLLTLMVNPDILTPMLQQVRIPPNSKTNR